MGREQDIAEALALEALGWIASDDGLIAGFLESTGLAGPDLLVRAAEPDVMAAAVDFLLAEDARVIGFCAATGRRPDAPGQARAFLAGGNDPHWT
jgi:Protein of unknown function (DUF3572)